jgi:hypothetical protein
VEAAKRSARRAGGAAVVLAAVIAGIAVLAAAGWALRWPLHLPFVTLGRMVRAAALSLYAAAPVLAAGSILARRFLPAAGETGPALRLAAVVAIGLSLLFAAGMALLACGAYHEWLLGAVALAVNLGIVAWVARRRFEPARAWRTAAASILRPVAADAVHLAGAAVLVLLALAALYALVPPDTRDEVTYHLVVPQMWARAHGWWLPLDNFHWYFPGNAEIGWGFGIALGGPLLPRMLSFLVAGLTLLLLREWLVEEGFSRWTRQASLLFLVATPLTLAVLPLCYVEWPLLFFLLLGWRALREHARGGERAWLGLAGLAFGASLGIKYSAIPAVVLLALDAAIRLARRRQAGAAAALGVAVLAGALVLASPWWLRNLAATGDPFYPLGAALPGGGSASHGDIAVPEVDTGPLVSYAALGGGYRLDPLFYHATVDRTSDHRLHLGWPFLHLVALFLGWRSRRALPWIAVAGLTAVLFGFTPSPRIYLPLLLLTWLFLPEFLEPFAARRGARWAVSATLALCVLTALPSVLHFWFLGGRAVVLEYLLGMTGEAGVLRREGLRTPVSEWVRERTPEPARVWVWCDDRVLDFDRWVRADGPYGRPAFAAVAEREDGAAALAREVARDGIDYVAVNLENCPLLPRADGRRQYSLSEAGTRTLEAWMREALEPVARDERFALFRVRARP